MNSFYHFPDINTLFVKCLKTIAKLKITPFMLIYSYNIYCNASSEILHNLA